MRLYPTATAVSNGLVPPDYRRPAWSYEQRARRFGALNAEWTHGKGQKRRERRELSTEEIGQLRRALLAGATELHLYGLRKAQLRNSWRVLMYAPLAGRSLAVHDLRAKIRARLDALVQHGPWSGWGVEDPLYGKQRAHSYARYVVPKTSEKVWRWWRALGVELYRLVQLLDAWWFRLEPEGAAAADARERGDDEPAPKVVPAHHHDSTTGEALDQPRSSRPDCESRGQECRDHVPHELRELLRRFGPRAGA